MKKMGSESEDDPFAGTHTDSDSDFVPSEGENNLQIPKNSTESDSEPANLKLMGGKKRVRKEKLWKRNERKAKRVAGVEYINVKGNTVPERVMGNDCGCRLKCFNHVTPEVRKKVFEAFYRLESKDLQDSYLSGKICVRNVERKRARSDGNNKPKGVSCTYKVRKKLP